MPSVVGIESKVEDLTAETETKYFPPSHWSTSNSQESSNIPNFSKEDDQSVKSVNTNSNRQDGAKAILSNPFFNRNGKLDTLSIQL